MRLFWAVYGTTKGNHYKKKNLNEKDILRIADLVCQLQVK